MTELFFVNINAAIIWRNTVEWKRHENWI